MRARVTVLVVLLISLSSAAAQQAPEESPTQSGKFLSGDQPAPARRPKRARRARRAKRHRHEELILTVRVYDYARLDRPLLVSTTRQAGRIFRKAGVAMDWVLCSPIDPRIPDVCNAPLGPADLVLRIVRRLHPGHDDSGRKQCGVALEDQEGRGTFGTLYADCLEILPPIDGLRSSEFLGLLFAHEIGHLLLPTEDDTSAGVMRAVEGPEEWKLAVIGRLRFTPRQARTLRAEVGARTAALTKSDKREEEALAEQRRMLFPPRVRKGI